MADTSKAVWGIDIGQYALKAIKIRYLEGAGQVAAVAFDYIPFPKILSQPDAVPEELIPEAISTFLARNDVKDDLIAVSVPGHASLTRFIQLPPVESGKLAEIVKYEAKQQIPFALEDVIWDYQPLGSGIEESGYLLDAEVGLFAMKKEQVYQSLRPFQNAKLEVELIQIAPLGLFNYLGYDELGMQAGDAPPNDDEHFIVLDMGCDNTTLMVSNGAKIWIRNVPLGGNHFTRALTKEMKLSFAKAEHLKCNATKSPDPRAVFQALRPVFNDYVAEIQRSIGFFSSVNRTAKINKVIGLGNGFKLAGLQKFLQQNLQYEVERPDTFKRLAGDSVLNSPLFADNVLSFAVPYGIALQVLDLTTIKTTLLPPEIATERLIRRKKPWAVMTAASLLVGLSLATVGNGNAYRVPHSEEFAKAESKVTEVSGYIGGKVSAFNAEKGRLTDAKTKLNELITGRRDTSWLELFRAINDCLPRDVPSGVDESKEEIERRNQISIVQIDTQHLADVGTWFTAVSGDKSVSATLRPYDLANPPTGEGYVVSLHGIHYHKEPNDNRTMEGILYVRNTLLKHLQEWTVLQPGFKQPQPVNMLGISHAAIVFYRTDLPVPYDPPKQVAKNEGASRIGFNPQQVQRPTGRRNLRGAGAQPGYEEAGYESIYARGAGTGAAANGEEAKYLDQTAFVIQFVWQYKKPEDRVATPPWSSGEDAQPLATELPANGEPPAEEVPATESPDTEE
ncbi:MAG: type IV pilus assembly protein PilM [Planctomycetaceae bacterium]